MVEYRMRNKTSPCSLLTCSPSFPEIANVLIVLFFPKRLMELRGIHLCVYVKISERSIFFCKKIHVKKKTEGDGENR